MSEPSSGESSFKLEFSFSVLLPGNRFGKSDWFNDFQSSSKPIPFRAQLLVDLLTGHYSTIGGLGKRLANGLRVKLHPLTSLSPINILSLTFQFHSQEYRHEIEGVRKEKERLTAVQQAFDLLTAEVNRLKRKGSESVAND